MDSIPTFEEQVLFSSAEQPAVLNPRYFTPEGSATAYLNDLAGDIRLAWEKVSSAELKGLFVAGSQAEGMHTDSSDLDVVVFREESAYAIPFDRPRLVSQLQGKYQVLKKWGRGKKPDDVDFIITRLPFGRLFDMAEHAWVEGVKKHPKMYNIKSHIGEVPVSLIHIQQGLGEMNRYFWEVDNTKPEGYRTSYSPVAFLEKCFQIALTAGHAD